MGHPAALQRRRGVVGHPSRRTHAELGIQHARRVHLLSRTAGRNLGRQGWQPGEAAVHLLHERCRPTLCTIPPTSDSPNRSSRSSMAFPSSTYNCDSNYCGVGVLDVFDPKWAQAYAGEVTMNQKIFTGGFATIPWIDRHHHRRRRLLLAAQGNWQRSVCLSEHSVACRGHQLSAVRLQGPKALLQVCVGGLSPAEVRNHRQTECGLGQQLHHVR